MLPQYRGKFALCKKIMEWWLWLGVASIFGYIGLLGLASLIEIAIGPSTVAITDAIIGTIAGVFVIAYLTTPIFVALPSWWFWFRGRGYNPILMAGEGIVILAIAIVVGLHFQESGLRYLGFAIAAAAIYRIGDRIKAPDLHPETEPPKTTKQ